MEVQLFQDTINEIGLVAILVDAINVSRAASTDKAGMSRVSHAGGMVEMRDVMQWQMLLNRLSSSTTA